MLPILVSAGEVCHTSVKDDVYVAFGANWVNVLGITTDSAGTAIVSASLTSSM